MNIKTLIAGFGLLAAQSLAAQNIFIAPVNGSGAAVPPTANFVGESTDRNHAGWGNLLSASFSTETPVNIRSASAGGGPGKPVLGSFVITKTLDASSQFYFLNSVQGRSIAAMTIDYGRSSERGSQVYQTIILKNVFVSSYKQNSGDGNEPPIEEIALTYGSIEFIQTRNDATGKPAKGKTYGWNAINNTVINP